MAWSQSGGYQYPSPYQGEPRPDSEVLAPVRGVAIAAVLGLCFWMVIQLADVGVNVWRYMIIGRLEKGEEIDPSLLDAHDLVYRAAGLMVFVALVVAGVPFVIWLFRVRANAEAISDRSHLWGRPWLIFSWIVPIANLWWPKRLVDDIWVASDPRFLTAADSKRPWLVRAWWTTWVLYLILDRVVAQLPDASAETDTDRQAATNAITVAPVGILAAVLAVLVVHRLSAIQETRRRELAAMLG